MWKKNKILIILLCLILLSTLGVTIAFFTADDNVVNSIKMGKVDIEVAETVEKGIKTNVGATVKAGTTPCWVRVFVGLPTGMQKQILVKTIPEKPNDNWSQEGNYYYYQLPLGGKNEDETVILFQEIRSEENLDINQVQDELDIVVYAEAIQESNGTNAIEAFHKKK